MTSPHLRRLLKTGLLAGCSLLAVSATATFAQDATTTAASADETVVVLGSRIPRSKKEGPAPVTTITAEDIRAGGYASVPDVLKTVTQNSGETQSQQSGNAADYSPGAQQVDLRGLGPNHTLVMVNGRRVADYPMAFNGDSNFTDISNIPLGMVDRIEILSGSASAIYGSDALAGVVNFKLKDHYDGTSTLDYRYGWTEQGGGQSHRLSWASGFEADRLHAVFGGEVLLQDPIFGYQRSLQDSTLDAPAGSGYEVPVTNWQRLDTDAYYTHDATAAQCALTSHTNNGTTKLATDDYYSGGDNDSNGDYCGSETAVGYRTIQSRHNAVNLIGSFTWDLSDRTHLFTDVQFGVSKIEILKRPTSWSYEDESGDDSGNFWNSFEGVDDNWYRIFTPEEMGGLDRAMRHVDSNTLTLTPGVRGTFGADDTWNYEVAFNASFYDSKVRFPLINFRKANAFFLGTQAGTYDFTSTYTDDTTTLPVFNADPTRFYTPLTVAQYNSIAEDSIYKPKSSMTNLSAQVETGELFQLPAGPVGFSALIEAGNQSYDLGTDPKAVDPYYFSWTDSPGKGHRTHWATGVEFSIPLLSTLQSSVAGRYDQFTYAGHDVGQGTYNLGLEYRPHETILLRAAYGTGFRAPDLNYVYKGIGYEEGRAPDYYNCYLDYPDDYPGDCGRGPRIAVQTQGSLALEPETSESINAGFVWSPSRMFDMSADYYKIKMTNQVEDLDLRSITRTEAACRIGELSATSPTCVDAISRVVRNSNGSLKQVNINPINVSNETTSGMDISAHLRFSTPVGKLILTGNITHAFDHSYTRYVGDAPVNQLELTYSDTVYFYTPRDKASLTASLKQGAWSFGLSGNYVDRLPNYDEDDWVPSYTTWNGSVQYKVNDKVDISLAITNLFDTLPPKDPTWTSYPYYNTSWYDGIGRSGFLQVTMKY